MKKYVALLIALVMLLALAVPTAFAEDKAESNTVMTMTDWSKTLDGFLTFAGRKILQGFGSISREDMERYVKDEFRKYNYRRLHMPDDSQEIILDIPDEIDDA